MTQRAAFLLVLIFCISLCACTSQSTPQTVNNTEKDDAALSLITSSSGIICTELSADEECFYFLRGMQDATAQILKYSLETFEITELSSEPVPDILGGGFITRAGSRMLVFKTGHVPYKDIYEGMSSILYILDMDGTVKNAITLPAQQLFKSNSAVAFDGDHTLFLILSLLEDGDSGPVNVKDELCSVDLASGEITSLETLSVETSTVITATCPDGLILTTIANRKDLTQSVYSLEKGETVRGVSFDFLDNAYTYVTDGSGGYYYINDGEDTLMYGSIYGGTKVVAKDLNITGNAEYLPYISSVVCDNHLTVDSDNSLTSDTIYVDLASGEITKAPEREFSCRIAYESEDYIVLSAGIEYIDTAMTVNGVEYPFEEGATRFIAVPKAEFWSGSAEYIEFNDLVRK